MKKLRCLAFAMLFALTAPCCKSVFGVTTLLDIRDFGAQGDGHTDDFIAIQNCINHAVKNPHTRIIIPFGKYMISQELKVDYTDGVIEIIGEKRLQESPTLECSNPTSALSIRGYFSNISTGSFIIKNINISGRFTSAVVNEAKLINGDKWFTGLKITDKKEAFIDNVDVSHFYGEGIYISTTNSGSIIPSSRFKKVTVQNCSITNCWGYNPKTDSYGDGIYLSDVANGYIANNNIQNRFLSTGYLGRCGIVIEYRSERCSVLNNTISGYDRALHIEADYGNHLIKGNFIKGTDLGIIVISPSIANHNNPIKIVNNDISNEGLLKGKASNRTYGITSIGDRSMIYFYAEDDCRKGSLIRNNRIRISGKFDYFSNASVNIKANNITLSSNEVIITEPRELKYPLIFYNYSNSLLVGNKLSEVLLKVMRGTDIDVLKKRNTIASDNVEFIN